MTGAATLPEPTRGSDRHHPLVEDFFSGRRSSQGLAGITFGGKATSPGLRRCQWKDADGRGCRREVRKGAPNARYCPAHAGVQKQAADRVARRKYKESQREKSPV